MSSAVWGTSWGLGGRNSIALRLLFNNVGCFGLRGVMI